MIVHIRDMTADAARCLVVEGDGAIIGVPSYDPRLKHWDACFSRAVANNLRFCTKSHTMRDNRLGMLQQPVGDPGPECPRDDAEFYLSRKVWCACVRQSNIEEEQKP